MKIAGIEVQIVRIYGHTHPLATGPSDGDLEALLILTVLSGTLCILIGNDIVGRTRLRTNQ
jgi:hypothetical protein